MSDLERAWILNGRVWESLFELGDQLVHLENDRRAVRLWDRMRLASETLNTHLRMRMIEEQAARGLGDPAVTSAAQDGADTGHAGELVGRGRKTRLRT